MAAVPLPKKTLIIINFAVLVGLLVINGLSNIKSPLFPNNIGNISNKYPTEITPSGPTFAIWGFIYTFQVSWTIYTLTLNCRANAADILPAKFYSFYILSCICNITWLFSWVREEFTASLALLAGTVVSLAACVFSASKGLHDYLGKQTKPSTADVWCVRILVQNGIIFYNAWVTIATCINLVVTLHYHCGYDEKKTTTAALAALLCITVFWFVMENFVFESYTRFIFAEYIVLIVGLSGVIKQHWTDGHGNQTFVLVNLIVSALMLIARIVLIIFQEKKMSTKEKPFIIMKP